MTARQSTYVSQCANHPHNIFYKEWGEENNPNVLVCVHGLTRNSGDFDYLNSKLEDHYRIFCPDMPGRGQSDWLPKGEYNYQLYMAEAAGMLARLGTPKLDWVGTSMGGFIGIMLAAMPNTPIRKLVLNDVGPIISKETQISIGKSVGNDDRFNTMEEVIVYLKKTYFAWEKMGEEHWVNVAKQSSRKLDNGTYALAYDPAIIAPLKENLDTLQEVNVWPVFETIQVPMLLLHGAESTVLTMEDALEMKRRNKNLELVHCPGVGHAPSLMEDYQVKVIRDWLLK